MLNFDTKAEKVTGVGPKYRDLLEKLEIKNVRDFLYHFPFRYDDYSEIKNIKDIQEGETVTLRGTLGPVENIFTKFGKKLTKAVLADHSGKVDLVWFNQHFLKKVLLPGQIYSVSGRVTLFNNKPSILNPEIEAYTAKSLNTGRLVPVYPETYGISSKWLRSKIHNLLTSISETEDFLPEKILKKYNFPDINLSMNSIHFPESREQLERARSRFAFEELFIQLLKVEKKKFEWNKSGRGTAINKAQEAQEEFIESLPFTLTDSQKKAVEEILDDMSRDVPMNRLLEGDVGTGKTVVAVIAAYITKHNKLKTLYMVPTELLAHQHYETFKALLDPFNVNISLLTGSVKNHKDNNWDILIGTHALLYNNEEYSDTGLVIIDEQHRFGVKQRGKLLDVGKNKKVPHLLTMTATPIPRTLALTLYGDLSISVLDTHPNLQRKIHTKVVSDKDRDKAYEWILDKNEPAFIVCPLIESSESETMTNVKAAEDEYEKLKHGVFKDVDVGLVHGRMKSNEKKQMLENFKNGKIKILIATPVIEVGIDVPEASIMVIESAERYGLATLHQLRGRVGRGDKPGYCFIFMSDDSKSAYKRLKNLENIDSGLKLAELDLELRGEGDIFSTLQHGFKRFKIADLSDFELLSKVKSEAENLFPELDKYPKLKEAIMDVQETHIRNN
ncbi:ATP-dependent DNA helicase RecG [candidate division WWE3 bacterium]|jgi:ATP-dependent DNA helicase RecG|uniref:ATP-dependent DNA helicase RecG n=1 Tax=candidate division WWE3 bacterium TaxID=2053526 RepID=A0A3A4ZDW2_UNCKA|nr:MAG: ATP-dependent DNA helicase RecG [candidate division WWE3 bacterium]